MSSAMLICLRESDVFLPGPGRCIYCWPKADPGGQLTREHIIARKMGGKLVLHRASCKPCECLINKEIETPALGQMWVSQRAHLGLPSSKPRTTIRIRRWAGAGEEDPAKRQEGETRIEDVPISSFGFLVALPKLKMPGIMRNSAPSDTGEVDGIYWRVEKMPPWLRIGERISFDQQVNPFVFGRFLAKVAHGAAVARLGLDAFTPFLPEVIKGNSLHVFHYVGASSRKGRRHPALHRVSLLTKGELLIARVQLFARFGMPPYEVAVGPLSGELARLHRSSAITVSTSPQ